MKKFRINSGKIFYPKAGFYLLFILHLVVCPIWGQTMQKSFLSSVDYDKWGVLVFGKLSPDGSWASFKVNYENGRDTLFVRNTKTHKTYFFPLAGRETFLPQSRFVCQSDKGLHLLDLKTGSSEIISHVKQFICSEKVQKIVILIDENKTAKMLRIRNFEGSEDFYIKDVENFVQDPDFGKILYTSQKDGIHAVRLLKLDEPKEDVIIHKGSSAYDNLAWQNKGEALSFTQKLNKLNNQASLYFYNLQNKKTYEADSLKLQNFLGDSLFVFSQNNRLKISGDMKKVFFSVKKIGESIKKNCDVQLWNGNAGYVYTQKKNQKSYMAVWFPSMGKINLISNDTLSEYMLTGDQKYALLSEPEKYEPDYTEEGLKDYYLKDVETGKIKLFLKKHPGHFLKVLPSPTGRYIAYFLKRNWWIYDIKKETHINLTKKMEFPFFHNNSEHPNVEEPYLNVGWTPEDAAMLIHDEFDLWSFSPEGKNSRRFTRGRETQTQFRLAGFSRSQPGEKNYYGWLSHTVDISKGMLLEFNSMGSEKGYSRWHSGLHDKVVSSDSTMATSGIYSSDFCFFVYSEQSYDLPPRLMVKTKSDTKPELLYQSNTQQEKFHWGKCEVQEYTNSKGKKLKAMLYYPAAYDPLKKYPMIVYIYEKLSGRFNRYINPSEYTGDGLFNITNFTSQEYFVLAPDISYELGEPGISAVDCVVSAVKKVVENNSILPSRIGIIGHSFGGYEVDFILTHTNIFTAAVAGSALTDLTSFYLSIGRSSGRPDIWRLESQQWRMGKSLFEDREAYKINSPIEYAENITTPLLHWTGGMDKEVNPNQSIELYLALRRLKKQQIMLVYPDEGHTVQKKNNQKDLSVRILEWFDYYLRDAPPASWIKSGLL